MRADPAVEAAVDRVAPLLNARIGLRPDSALRGRLRRSICDEAAARSQSPVRYVASLAADGDALQQLMNRVTIQETAFFRHPEHFDVLAREILPALPRPVTIWSAGCANGQEAYSLAMILVEQGIAGSVIATDISTAALHRTSAASYTEHELTGLSAARIGRYMIPAGSGSGGARWQVADVVRGRVVVQRHNLLDPLPDRIRNSQVVFCRNVLIYLSMDHVRVFVDRVADLLPDGGCLFLGSAESIWPISDRFDAVRLGDAFVYLRSPTVPRAAPAAVARPPRARQPAPAREQVAAVVKAVPAELLAKAGQDALDAGDWQLAVVAFRKWTYLAPADTMAHLHLGLALEAAGDRTSAQRAFGAARRTVATTDGSHLERAIEGYAAGELVRLLDAKGRAVTS